MHVYFVRHGVTEGNRAHVHQPFDSPLSAKGKKQLSKVGSALKHIPVDAVVSSSMPRAIDSAAIINETCNASREEWQALTELRRPDSLIGRSHYAFKTILYVFLMILKRRDPEWHFEGGGENIAEIRKRARDVRTKLEEMSESHEHVVVVSHAIFLEILITTLCQDERLSFFDFLPIFSPLSRVPNASISHVLVHPDTHSDVCRWETLELYSTKHLR